MDKSTTIAEFGNWLSNPITQKYFIELQYRRECHLEAIINMSAIDDVGLHGKHIGAITELNKALEVKFTDLFKSN